MKDHTRPGEAKSPPAPPKFWWYVKINKEGKWRVSMDVAVAVTVAVAAAVAGDRGGCSCGCDGVGGDLLESSLG